MTNCEICGEERDLVKAIVEGSLLDICNNCIKFGNAVVVKEIKKEEKPVKKTVNEVINIITPDYPKLIKEAREKLNLRQQELASKINEKESIIHKLETGSMQPTILIARKLEKTLNITLVELYQESHEGLNFKDDVITIGDLVKQRNRNF